MLLFLIVFFACALSVLPPPRLRPGDTVAFVSPCSPICDLWNQTSCPEGFQQIVEQQFNVFGLNVVWGKHAFDHDQYLAGTDEDRAADLNAMFLDPSVSLSFIFFFFFFFLPCFFSDQGHYCNPRRSLLFCVASLVFFIGFVSLFPGEGSARMLHLLNFSSFPPKIVMGYSDMTAGMLVKSLAVLCDLYERFFVVGEVFFF
jgi:hypothetical protein